MCGFISPGNRRVRRLVQYLPFCQKVNLTAKEPPMKTWLYLLLLLMSQSLTAQVQKEESMSLNGSWAFKTDPSNIGESAAWFSSNSSAAGWDSLSVPGNWDLKNEYAHYAGKAWYRKEVEVPAAWQKSVVRLLFEGVNNDSKVWLNGHLLGTNNLGYLPFEFDVSSLLKAGGKNTVVVCADNTFRRGAIWNWGGIRRPVTIIATPTVYIRDVSVTPTVNLADRTATVHLRINAVNSAATPVSSSGTVVLSAKNGFTRTLPFSISVKPGSEEPVSLHAKLSGDDVHLWGFDDPFLYNCQVTMNNNDGTSHYKNIRFGLRKIELDNQRYALKLNGSPIRVMGFNLVPDDRTTGSTLPLWRIKEDIDLIKSFGGNLARLTHLPMHREMLDYLDEKGILVFEEIPLWGFDPLVNKTKNEPFEWLHRLVKAHYNHPSIIGWGVGNEIGYVPTVMSYVDTAIQVVKRLDTTRLAVMVSHTANRSRQDPIQFSDLGLINHYGPAIGSLADRIHALHPEKVLFYTEYGYGQSGENLDAFFDAKGMVDSLRWKPYLVGGSLWTFNDYRSSYAGTKEPSENRAWGIVNAYRQKKKAFDLFRKEYAPVRDMQVRVEAGTGSVTATVRLTPRLPLDLPAYELNGYTLVCKGYNKEGQLTGGGFVSVPLIQPGQKPVDRVFSWKNNTTLSRVQVELLSPQHYSVYDTVLFLQQPPPPEVISIQGMRTEINDIRPNTGAIKIVLQKPSPGVLYKASYTRDGITRSTVPTRNPYIDIPNLSFGEVYTVSVSSVNNFGESAPTDPQAVKVDVEAGAPVIYYTEPADKGFFVALRTHPEDYMYEVAYTTKPGDYTNAKSISATTKGVLFVPHLQNGQAYSFRLRSIKQNHAHSNWSEERSITPDGRQLPLAPVVQGVLRDGSKAVLCFEPVKKATGYTVQYKADGDSKWRSIPVTAAVINHVIVDGLQPGKIYAFRMQTESECGHSHFSTIVTR